MNGGKYVLILWIIDSTLKKMTFEVIKLIMDIYLTCLDIDMRGLHLQKQTLLPTHLVQGSNLTSHSATSYPTRSDKNSKLCWKHQELCHGGHF